MSTQEEEEEPQGVVEFATTRGPVLGPSGFRRVTTLSGGVADLSRENSTPLYLWSRKSNTGPFVTNLKVINDESSLEASGVSDTINLDDTNLLVEKNPQESKVIQVLASTVDDDKILHQGEKEEALVVRLHRNLCLRLYTDADLAARTIAAAKSKSQKDESKAKKMQDLPTAQQVLDVLSELNNTSVSLLTEKQEELLFGDEHFLEKALLAARASPQDKPLINATFSLAQTILRIIARALAGATDGVRRTHTDALRQVFSLGGCVITERISDLALSSSQNIITSTTSVQTTDATSGVNQHKSSRFFSRFSSSASSSSKRGENSTKPESRPLRRPQRIQQNIPQQGLTTTATDDDTIDIPTERLVQAACTRAGRTLGDAKKKANNCWPLDPVSEDDDDDDEESTDLPNNTPLRFSKAVLKGGDKVGLSFFCGDGALAVRRAKEDTAWGKQKKNIDETAGTGALLDFWAALGGIDALLVRMSPNTCLYCDANALILLLDAITPALQCARGTTSSLMARLFARALQRAANARIRDLAADRLQSHDLNNDQALDDARLALRRCLAQVVPEAFVSARRALKEQLATQSSEARGGSWKQSVANYWGNNNVPMGNPPIPISSQVTNKGMIREIKISAERLELEVASARLFRGDSDMNDSARLLGVATIGRIADAVLWAAQPYELRPRDVEAPPWITTDSDDITPSWILNELKLAHWLARRDIPAAIIALAVRRREALECGLSVLCVAAQCGPFSQALVDAITSLCVHEALRSESSSEHTPNFNKLTQKTWVALAQRLQPELVARQRDEMVKALVEKKPTIYAVMLVADFAHVAAPRLLRAAAQLQQQQQQLAVSPRSNVNFPCIPPAQILASTGSNTDHDDATETPSLGMEGGLELLWYWTATDENENSATTRAGIALAAILRRPTKDKLLDRPSLICAERCLDALSSEVDRNFMIETRICRLLTALCVANSHDILAEKGEANHVHARRRALERKHGPLGHIALRRAMKGPGKNHAVLRLYLALAADAADLLAASNNTPRRYALSESSYVSSSEKLFNRISVDDASLLITAAGLEEAAAFFAVAAERRALEPAAAEKMLLEIEAKCPPTCDDARAGVALYEVAANPNDMHLVDALVRLIIRAPIQIVPKAASRQLARICAGATRDMTPAARVADGCVRAVMESDDDEDMAQRAAGVLEHLFMQLRRLPPPTEDEDKEIKKNIELVRWLAGELDTTQLDSPFLFADDDENTVEVRLASTESLSSNDMNTPPFNTALKRVRCKLRLALALTGSVGTAYAKLWRPDSSERNSLCELVIYLASRAANPTENCKVDTTLDLALELLHALLRRDSIATDGKEEKNTKYYIPAEKLTLLINALLVQRICTFPRALALILLLARLERPRGQVVEALTRHSNEFGTGLQLALLPSIDMTTTIFHKASIVTLRGEAYALARDTAKCGEYAVTLILVTSLLTPLDNEPEQFTRQAYARCCEFVALLLDELRLAMQSRSIANVLKNDQKAALTRVAERLANDVVERRYDLAKRVDDETPNQDDTDDRVRRASMVDSSIYTLYAYDENEKEKRAADDTVNTPTQETGGTTVERARFALLGACVRCGGKPSNEALIKCAHHLASRCRLLGYTERADALAPLDIDGSASGAATRSVALDTLSALCEASGEALIDICTAASALHSAVFTIENNKEDLESVAARLEAADVVRLAPSLQRLQTLAATGTPVSNLPNRDAIEQQPPPPPPNQQRSMIIQNPPAQRRPGTDFVVGAPPSARFSSVIVPAERPNHGLAGLDNLGCTCYLNSTLQMLVATNEFRNVVLALDTDINGKQAVISEATERQKLLLARELQLIVARLLERDAVSISPRTFCDTFKWDGGESIDVRQQQDASEFIASLFQQLEQLHITENTEEDAERELNSELLVGQGKDTREKRLAKTAASHLEAAFGGIFAHELSALSDPKTYTSRREESFYLLAVEVKDKQRLEEALEAYIEPEIVEYSWRDGGKRERTSKGVLIKKPPNHLLIHLKRFEFDLETLTQRKINSRFEFSKELDLAPYMTNNSKYIDSDGTCLYELDGIVVHAGTANSGHYYAFIRCKDNEWFEFNDAFVAPFDIDAEIDAECFGGFEKGNQNGRERTRNAFILSYRRIFQNNVTKTLSLTQFETTKFVASENIALRRARAMFDDSNLSFLSTLVERALLAQDIDPSKQSFKAAVQLGILLCTRTLVRARDDDSPALLTKCASAIVTVFLRGHADSAAKDLLLPQQNSNTLLDALRRCAVHPDEGARESLTLLFAAALCALYSSGRKVTSSVWSRNAKPEIFASNAARTLIELAATTVSSEKRSRNNYYDDSYERIPQRVACDILVMFLRREEQNNNFDKARSWLIDLEPVETTRSLAPRPALVFASCTLQDEPFDQSNKSGITTRTTTRQLAAVATRIELVALLGLSRNETTILDQDDNAVATLVAGCVALLDRGAYSKRVGDEARRRCSSARQILEQIVHEDARKSQITLSTIVALLERCQLGLDAMRRKQRQRANMQNQEKNQDLYEKQFYEDELLELDSLDVEGLYDRGDDDENRSDQFSAHQKFDSHAASSTYNDDMDDTDDNNTLRHERFSYTPNFLRRAWRALACVIAVNDSFRHWRVTKGLSRAIAATEQCARINETPNKLRICIEELLKICKRDPQAREWVRSHRQACEWLIEVTPETGLSSATPTSNTNVNNANSFGGPPSNDGDASMGFVATSLDTLRAPLGAVRSWTERRRTGSPSLDPQERRQEERRNEDIARRVRILLSQQPDTVDDDDLAPFDSDDEPQSIVGRRVKVRWAGGTFYSGTITKFDDSGHHVHYDDGDSKSLS